MSWRRMSMRRTSRHGASADSCDQCDVLRSVNGTASKWKTFLATATEECCPARGTLAGHFTRRLSPSPMPGKRIQPQRAYLPLKRSSPRPQFYRLQPRDPWARLAQPMPVRWTGCHSRVRGIASKDRLLDEYQALLLSDQLVRQSVIPASASDCDPAYSLRRVPT